MLKGKGDDLILFCDFPLLGETYNIAQWFIIFWHTPFGQTQGSY